VLGVPQTASVDEIKAAYRRLALKYHPDRNPGDRSAEARFKEISEAYATLRDPEARARFDRFCSSRPEAARPDFSQVDWQTVFQEADIHINWQAGAPRTGNAVFDALFGVVTGMMRGSGLLPGEDREVALELSLDEARLGALRRIRLPGPSVCAQCRGSGASCSRCGGRGVVRGFDAFTILLESPGKPVQLVYKHAVTSIVPSRPVPGYGPSRAPQEGEFEE
jgi:molecular chaperone DnaJ